MKLDGITEPAVTVEIDTSLIGAFVWGISEWGGTDTWSSSNGEWTPVAASTVRSLSLRRGRTREDQAVQPGTMTAVLDNLSGDYAPDNESSPWRWGAESLMQRGIGVRVRAGFRPAVDLEAERLLKTAVLYLDAQNPGATPTATVKNLGTGRAALNATLGSSATADSNDPKWLEYAGTAYCYLPGVARNALNVPDAAALDITGEIDLRVQCALDDWTPAAQQTLLAKYASGAGLVSYLLDVNTAGTLRLLISSNGSSATSNASSTVATGVSDGAVKWVRATYATASGDVKFYLSDDGSTWTQLGTTVSTAAGAIFSSSSAVYVGTRSDNASNPAAGKFYRAQILNGIGGTTVLDVDTSVLTSGAATSFTATTGQAVTINRGTSGRKAAVVTESKWLLGTDDYMEVADNALLDFTASDSFTVLAVVRQWATVPSANVRVIDKMDSVALNGWALITNTSYQAQATMNGGSYLATAVSSSGTAGALSTLGMVRTGSTSLAGFRDGSVGTASVIARTDVTNAQTLRIGTDRGVNAANTFAGEVIAVAVFREALTAAQITALNTYFQTRAATPATMQTLFRGYIETVDADLGFTPMATITASDGLAKIANTQVPAITANYAGDTTATRIGRVLDAISWDSTLRDLTGSRTMLDTTYGASALNLADEAAACEYGVFYASKSGYLTLKTYEAGLSTTLRFQLSDDPTAGLMDYADLTTKPSTEYMVNNVTLTVGTATVTSTNAQSSVLRGEVSRTWTTPLDSLVTAQALADIIVDRLSANTVRADSVEIICAGLTTTEWGNVIAAELHERLTAARTTRDGRHRSYNCIIESINHDITPRGWTLRMNLSPGLGGAFFVWGTSLWGGDDRWYY